MSLGITERQYRLFWEKVNKKSNDECWVWTAATNGKGYGVFCPVWKQLKTTAAHRISWFIHHNKILDATQLLCHHCDNSLCINPHHLFIGTQRDNVLDMHRKGRARGMFKTKTICKRGHPLSGPNLYSPPNGSKVCRICAKKSQKRWQTENKEHLRSLIKAWHVKNKRKELR